MDRRSAGVLRLTCTVMTHPRRLAQAETLARRAGGDTDVTVDPRPGDAPNPLRTALRAWGRCRAGASHHLVLQDDVVLAEDFLEAARGAAFRHPDRVVGLYVHSTSWNAAVARLAAVAGYGWTSALPQEWFPTQAAIMPCAVAHEFATHAAKLVATQRDDDVVLASFIRDRGLKTAIRVPNLVEHGGLPSLVGYDYQGIRRSVAFEPNCPEPVAAAVLEEAHAWPAFKQRRALLRMPSAHGRSRWQTRTRTAHLKMIDVRWQSVRQWAREAATRFEWLPERRSSALRFLVELRLAALTLGWSAAALVPPGGAGPPASRRVVDLALRSYIESGFGFDSALRPWLDELDELVALARESLADGFRLPAAAGSV